MAVKHRYTHAVHALAFTVLALSGLSILIKGNNPFIVLFGNKKIAAAVHKTTAWVYLITNLYLSYRILPEMGIRGNLTLKALFQRIFYWFVFLSLTIMVPSGLILIFRESFSSSAVLFTLSVHKVFALFLIGMTLVHAFLRFRKPSILFESCKAICQECKEKPCISVCPTKAINPNPDGTVNFNDVRCIGCGKCVEVCPYKVVYYSERGIPLYIKPVG